MEMASIISDLLVGFVGFVAALLGLIGVAYGVANTRRAALDRRSVETSVEIISFFREQNRQYGPSSGCSPVKRIFYGTFLSLLYLSLFILTFIFYYALFLDIDTSERVVIYALVTPFIVVVLAVYAFAAAFLWNFAFSLAMIAKIFHRRWKGHINAVPHARNNFEIAGSNANSILRRCAAVLEATGATVVLFDLKHGLIRANKGPSFPTVDYSRLVDEITINTKQREGNTIVEVSSSGTGPGFKDLARNRSNVERFSNYLLKYSL